MPISAIPYIRMKRIGNKIFILATIFLLIVLTRWYDTLSNKRLSKTCKFCKSLNLNIVSFEINLQTFPKSLPIHRYYTTSKHNENLSKPTITIKNPCIRITKRRKEQNTEKSMHTHTCAHTLYTCARGANFHAQTPSRIVYCRALEEKKK